MIPILYNAFEKDFTTNGIGLLIDTISCTVDEERNGIYEMQLVYPTEGQLAQYINEDSVVKVRANDEDKPQLFRLYKSGKRVGESTTWYGEHISYQLNANPVEKFNVSGVNAQMAMQKLFEGAVIPHEFTAHSDITTPNSTKMEEILSVRNILGGTTGSILDVWGGEYHFDNYKVSLLKKRGKDNGAVIEYGKNLISADQEKNLQNVVTSIFPYAKYQIQSAEGGETEDIYVSLPEKTLIHETASNFATIKCMPVDLSGEWESGTIITIDMLRKKGWEHLNGGITEPSISIKLSFVNLSQTKDYKNMKAMESVKLCDTLTVKILRLGIDAIAQVVKVQYNVLKERYESIEVGDVRANLAKSLVAQQKKDEEMIIKTATRSEQIREQIEKTIKEVTAAITGNSGGYVLLHPEKNPQEIFIMDTPSTATAKNVWRWNLAGLGHSDNGIGGPFTTAITADGQIVANFITAGELTGAILKAGTVYAESLDVEYKQSVKKYSDTAADNAREAAVEETMVALKLTADAIELYTKKMVYDSMHDYVVNGSFKNGFTDWYNSDTNNNIVTTLSGLGVVAKILKNGSSQSYIRQYISGLKAGKYVIKYKAATAAQYVDTARVQCQFATSETTKAGTLKADEFTTFYRDINLVNDGSNYIYIFAYTEGAPIYITDIQILGKLEVYTESRLAVAEQSITAEVKRAVGEEEKLSGRIKVTEKEIELKVTKGNVSSQLSVESGQVSIRGNRFVVDATNFSLTASGLATMKNATITGTFRSENGSYWMRAAYARLTGGYGGDIYGEIDFYGQYGNNDRHCLRLRGYSDINLMGSIYTSVSPTAQYVIGGATGEIKVITQIDDLGDGGLRWWISTYSYTNGILTSAL